DDDLELAAAVGEQLGEDGTLLDVLVFGAALWLLIPAHDDPPLALAVLLNLALLRGDTDCVLQVRGAAYVSRDAGAYPWLTDDLIDPMKVAFLPRHNYLASPARSLRRPAWRLWSMRASTAR